MRLGIERSMIRRALFCALLFVFAAHFAEAQAPGTGAITVTVTDPSGAVVPGAHVSIVNDETNLARSATTSIEGSFRAPLLPAGNYSMTVEAPGFERQTLHSIRVVVSETTVVDVRLKLGPSETQVEVIGTPQLVQTESATLGRPTDEDVIVAMPLANRNFTQILALSPGVVVELANADLLGKANQNVSDNGAKTTANNFQFNGIDANNISRNSASGFDPEAGIAIPAPDTILQFKVQTGSYDAAYGRSAGANVDLVSKAGSNQFHGNLWEFFRNDALNANEFFRKSNGQSRPVLKQNQFGFTAGGPIRRDRTFFFASYQGTIQVDGLVPNEALVTAFLPALTSDRSRAALGSLFGGQSGVAGGTAVATDGSNINPVALAILNFKFPNGQYAIPSPQTTLPGGIGESTFSIPAHYREDQFSANIDQNISARNQLSGRFFYSRAPQNTGFTAFGANVPGWGTNEIQQNDMFTLADTHVFSSTLINVARFGFMRFNGNSAGSNPISAAEVGMATPSGLPEIPAMVVQGLFTIGSAGQPFFFENTNTFVWQDTVSMTRGRHNFRFGGEAKRLQLDVNSPFSTDGFLYFMSLPDFLLGESAAQNGSSQSNLFQSVGASGNFRKDERYADLAGFIQDDIKVTTRLTLNTGLRYEIFGPPVEIHGYLSNFDPTIASAQAPAGGTFSGFTLPANFQGSVPSGLVKTSGATLWSTDYKNLGPRFGFALRLPGGPSVVLRGGYGIFYERLSAEPALQNVGQPPFALTQRLQGAQNAAATFQQPFNPALPPNSAYPIYIPRTPESSIFLAAISQSTTSPYTQQYNLNIQYQLAPEFLWEIGYVGSKTTHLAGCSQFNQALIATPQNPVNGESTTTNENLAQRFPYTGVAGGSYICGTSFDANYNSLQTSVTKRMSHGLNFLASYTWSKNIDFTSGTIALSSTDLDFLGNDQRNPRQSRGLNDFDRTHRFVTSFTYQPPRLQDGPRIARLLVSRWEFSGMTVLQSGLPITAIDSSAGSVYGNLVGFTRAECTGLDPASHGSMINRIENGYLNPNAFTNPPVIGDGTGFGNCGVGILRGPSQLNLDLGIHRNFSVTEKTRLQFRVEFFNFTNTPKFGQPINDHASGPGIFGFITSTVSNPRVVQLALKYDF